MTSEANKAAARSCLERAFNSGDLSALTEFNAPDGIDHQEPPGTNFIEHLTRVVQGLRTAFPDLHFEIHDIVAEGDIVAFRSTMTGTHSGLLNMGMGPQVPATGRRVSVPHMHFVRMVDGKTTDLWHLWNTQMMLQQLGVAGMPQPAQQR